MTTTDVIIGMIARYDFEMLAPFVRTLRQTGYRGDVVFFHRDVDDITLDRLRDFGVTLVPFEPSPTMAVYCQRYQLARDFLAAHPHYTRVMLSDTRDGVFQKQPFDFAMGEGICCFMEHEGITIGDTPINAQWIIAAFGGEELERLEDKPMVCSGITIGNAKAVQEYLALFLETI